MGGLPNCDPGVIDYSGECDMDLAHFRLKYFPRTSACSCIQAKIFSVEVAWPAELSIRKVVIWYLYSITGLIFFYYTSRKKGFQNLSKIFLCKHQGSFLSAQRRATPIVVRSNPVVARAALAPVEKITSAILCWASGRVPIRRYTSNLGALRHHGSHWNSSSGVACNDLLNPQSVIRTARIRAGLRLGCSSNSSYRFLR